MNTEKIFWKILFKRSTRSLSVNKSTRWLLGGTFSIVLALLALVFFAVGRNAVGQDWSTSWLTLGALVVVYIGLISGLLPIRSQASFKFLPISPLAFLWHHLVTTFRYPVLIATIYFLPFYFGQMSNWFYGWPDYLFLTCSLIIFTISLHVFAYGITHTLRRLVKHPLIRAAVFAGILVIVTNLAIGSPAIFRFFGSSFDSPTTNELFLVILGSLGLIGLAISIVEALGFEIASLSIPKRFWALLTRHRNFRASFGITESALYRTVINFLRNGALHQRLAAVLAIFLASNWLMNLIGISSVNAYILLLSVTTGLIAYFISFKTGFEAQIFSQNYRHIPFTLRKTLLGSFAGSLIGLFLVGSLPGALTIQQLNLSGSVTMIVLGMITFLAVGTVAFILGRWAAAKNSWLEVSPIVIIVISAIMFWLSSGFSKDVPTLTTISILTLWAAVLSLGSLQLFRVTGD